MTSNKPFGRWGEVFGDATVAAAMIDRLVHHAEVVSLKGDSYRLKDRDLGRVPHRRRSVTTNPAGGVNFQPVKQGQNSAGVDSVQHPTFAPKYRRRAPVTGSVRNFVYSA